MKGRNTITINGRTYDAISGMPLPGVATHQQDHTHLPADEAKKKQPHPAFTDISVPRSKVASPTLHTPLQHSQTLHRAALQRPISKHIAANAPTASHRSPAITKFGPLTPANIENKILAKQSAAETEALQSVPVHPAVTKALTELKSRAISQPAPQSSKALKEQLIKERLAEVATQKPVKTKRRLFRHKPRLTALLVSSLAVLILGGYLTFFNLPDISMRVAAARAGVAATFPNYQPDGYSFNGPITYAPGEVAVQFKSNTNSDSYTIKQKTSNWDNQAVLDNLVSRETSSYLTYQQDGLTIYSYDNKAAWVNGGMLYTIEGTAHLSSDQVLHIATSL